MGGSALSQKLTEIGSVTKQNSADNLTTLDAVPPGQHPSRMRPAERDEGSPSARLMIDPTAGIIVYCAAHPNKICSRETNQDCKGSTRSKCHQSEEAEE